MMRAICCGSQQFPSFTACPLLDDSCQGGMSASEPKLPLAEGRLPTRCRQKALVAIQFCNILDQLVRQAGVGFDGLRLSCSDLALALIEESSALEPLIERQ
jgi:hypothetical protein